MNLTLSYLAALESQPQLSILDSTIAGYISTTLLVIGGTLVLTSFLRLGITGTYLGDYFGILMPVLLRSKSPSNPHRHE